MNRYIDKKRKRGCGRGTVVKTDWGHTEAAIEQDIA